VTCREREQEYGIVPATLGLMAKKEIPGIEKVVQDWHENRFSCKKGRGYLSRLRYLTLIRSFLDIFTFHILLGDQKSIENHGNVLLSRKMATTLFGNELPCREEHLSI
jgi:hypothetical protein